MPKPKNFTLKQAARKARKDEHVKNIEKRGYFLNSGLLMLQPAQETWEKWTLTFYNTDADRVIGVDVGKGKKAVIVGRPAKASNPTKTALELKNVKTSAKRILKKATKEFEKFKQPLNQTIVTISGDPPAWKINFITKVLRIIAVEVDAKNAKILNSNSESILRIESKQGTSTQESAPEIS